MKLSKLLICTSMACCMAFAANAQNFRPAGSGIGGAAAQKAGETTVPAGNGVSTHLSTMGADGGMAKDMDNMRKMGAASDAQKQIEKNGSPTVDKPEDPLSKSADEQYKSIKEKKDAAAMAQAMKAGGCQNSCEQKFSSNLPGGGGASKVADAYSNMSNAGKYATASPEEKAKMDAEKKAKEDAAQKAEADRKAKIAACVKECMAK